MGRGPVSPGQASLRTVVDVHSASLQSGREP